MLDKILHDRARLEETDEFPIRESVSEGWNTAIRVDFQKPWLLLGILLDVDFMNFIGKALGKKVRISAFRKCKVLESYLPKLFKGHGNFDAIGCLGSVEVDVGGSGSGRHILRDLFPL